MKRDGKYTRNLEPQQQWPGEKKNSDFAKMPQKCLLLALFASFKHFKHHSRVHILDFPKKQNAK